MLPVQDLRTRLLDRCSFIQSERDKKAAHLEELQVHNTASCYLKLHEDSLYWITYWTPLPGASI